MKRRTFLMGLPASDLAMSTSMPIFVTSEAARTAVPQKALGPRFVRWNGKIVYVTSCEVSNYEDPASLDALQDHIRMVQPGAFE
jgi:hypothetical protein